MRSFFQFIIRQHVLFLFLLLETVALYLVFSSNAYHRSAAIHSANSFSGNILNTYGNLTRYFYLREVNDSLMAENALLKQALFREALPDTNSQIKKYDADSSFIFSAMPATVINNTFTLPNNYITINKGKLHGVQKDMGVITGSGIVGIVREVSENYAVVMSVLHGSFHTRVAVQRNNAQGRLVWRSGNPKMVEVIDVSEPGQLEKGDTIVTTGFSAAFPADFPVGTLVSYGKEEGSNFYTLQVQLTTNFNRLRFVYVIDNLRKEERIQLENTSTQDDS